jgi:uncharacterized YccA/Bax inhibitor family protein
MRSSNPALNEKVFREIGRTSDPSDTMTVGGTAQKFAVLLLLAFLPAVWLWNRFDAGAIRDLQDPALLKQLSGQVMPWMIGGFIGGFVVALVTIFRKPWARFTSPLYAILEGLALGGISLFMEIQFPGIVLQAVGLTFGVAFVMLALYQSRIIPVTQKFRMVIVGATGGIAVIYLLTWILGFFGVGLPFLHGSGTFGILFSLLVVGVAAFNLMLDFDLIEQSSRAGVPRYMEWYGAFGLLVTLVWLYLEILRLLSKLRQR